VELDGRTVSNYGYRFGYQGFEKDNEFKGNGKSYTTEFRQYNPSLGCWLIRDALESKYSFLSPYNFVSSNPTNNIEIDGNDFIKSTEFEKSGYYTVFNDVMINNTAYIKYFGMFENNPKLNIYFEVNNDFVIHKKIATTTWFYEPYTNRNGKKVLDRLDGRIAFREDIEYYNDLGKLILIAHESLHLYEGLKMQDGDQTHDLWLSNFSKMQEIVKEYSDDNNLGLNEDEIFELSIYNIGPGGTQFDDYVNKMATKYKTSYQEELESYYIRMDLLIDDEYKKSFYFENEIKQNPTDEDK
jgi:RHS repeat-associated protein